LTLEKYMGGVSHKQAKIVIILPTMFAGKRTDSYRRGIQKTLVGKQTGVSFKIVPD